VRKMKINIVGGGPVEHLPNLHDYNAEDCLWVGVDRGVTILLSKGLNPTQAFGDFDSVSKEELEQIEQHVKHLHLYQMEKDEPDMELALDWAIQQNPDKIQIFGGTGGRLDHFFANVQLLLRPQHIQSPSEISIIDVQNELFVKPAGTYTIEKKQDKKYVSFIPLSPSIKNLSLKDFKYPLTDCHIPIGSTLCISNELLNEYGTFSFTEGILLVIRSRD
jgi:thiamine pyrophosphokinase